mmetsp:Transcript_13763/g.19724  ORF Transcript_13763/g.19724 Transcript_13763/m.19724 type:complete len:298 (+) Transcript_13763:96-989(+)
MPIKRLQYLRFSFIFCSMIGLFIGRVRYTAGAFSCKSLWCGTNSCAAVSANTASRRNQHNADVPAFGFTRLFGSKPGSGVEGLITVENEQDSLRNVDIPALEDTMRAIRDILGYSTYDVSLFLSDDKEVKQMNYETRGVNASTDILSFQLHEAEKPGVLQPPEFDFPEYYTLGDMMISVPYVRRVCKSDQKESEKRLLQRKSITDAKTEAQRMGTGEQENILDDDRGVSLAMSTEFDPEVRIHMLLVHGMLHLVGYDHIEDDDYEIMVAKEEEVLRLLRERKGSFLANVENNSANQH